MERPAEATGREFLTDEEVAALERQAESRFSTAIENSAGITLGGDRADRGTTRVRERDGVVRRLVHHQVPQNGRVQPHGLRSALRPALDAAEMGGPPRDH